MRKMYSINSKLATTKKQKVIASNPTKHDLNKKHTQPKIKHDKRKQNKEQIGQIVRFKPSHMNNNIKCK